MPGDEQNKVRDVSPYGKKSTNIVGIVGFENEMNEFEINALFENLNGIIEEISNTDGASYTLNRTENGFVLSKINTKDDDTQETVKIFEVAHGKANFHSVPLDDDDRHFLYIYLESQRDAGKDIIVSTCNSPEAAIQLAEMAQLAKVRLIFKGSVLEKFHPNVVNKLMEIGIEMKSESDHKRHKLS